MKPNRFTAGVILAVGSSWNELQRTTSVLLIFICFDTDTIAYKLLSFLGPSKSSPSVLPSLENEWQLAQVTSFSITVLLCVSAMFRNFHLIKGTANGGRGWITPGSDLGQSISG